MPNLAEPAILSDDAREAALARYRSVSSGRERPGRFWKVDFDAEDLSQALRDASSADVTFANVPARVVACDLASAAALHGDAFTAAFGSALGDGKYASLARAFVGTGAFVHIPADLAADEPIVVTYRATGRALSPYTLVVAENGARATIVERIEAPDGALVCGACEIVTGDNADVTYAAVQTLPEDARIFMARAAAPGRSARIAWALADLGAKLSVGSADTRIRNEGVTADAAALFFPKGDQHVDLVTTVEHEVGNGSSETIVKSAATDRGQARYLGNIRIVAHAQGSNASLHDDALLLSQKAHIDSIPALEIAANDVKAYHGATVGAIDDELLFYMESRGIERAQSERMIALGFFEPAIARFPTESLRDEIRAALQAKI